MGDGAGLRHGRAAYYEGISGANAAYQAMGERIVRAGGLAALVQAEVERAQASLQDRTPLLADLHAQKTDADVAHHILRRVYPFLLFLVVVVVVVVVAQRGRCRVPTSCAGSVCGGCPNSSTRVRVVVSSRWLACWTKARADVAAGEWVEAAEAVQNAAELLMAEELLALTAIAPLSRAILDRKHVRPLLSPLRSLTDPSEGAVRAAGGGGGGDRVRRRASESRRRVRPGRPPRPATGDRLCCQVLLPSLKHTHALSPSLSLSSLLSNRTTA